MSENDYIPRQDDKLPVYLTNFTTYANANLTALGLAAADITPVTTGATAYQASLNTLETAHATYKQAVAAKDAARKAVVGSVRNAARKVQGNAAVTPAQKLALGLSPRYGTRTHPAPAQPTALIATPSADGTVLLNWKGNGNLATTVYEIEASRGNTGVWTQIGSTLTTRLMLTDQTPGVFVMYRVTAIRAKRRSVPSLSVSVYSPAAIGGTTSLKMAA